MLNIVKFNCMFCRDIKLGIYRFIGFYYICWLSNNFPQISKMRYMLDVLPAFTRSLVSIKLKFSLTQFFLRKKIAKYGYWPRMWRFSLPGNYI